MTVDGAASDDGFLQGMRDDKIGRAAKKDGLIMRLGRYLSVKFGNQKEQYGHIRGRMRHLGKLLLHLRTKTGNSEASLCDFVQPSMFREVVDAARECAGFDSARHAYRAPSSAIRSGQLMKKVATLNMTRALEIGDTKVVDASTGFLKLCDLQWSEVSTSAHRNLSERKRNGVEFLPLTEDVMRLNRYLVNEGKRNAEILLRDDGSESSIDAYAALAQVTLAKLTLFNRKRQGEVCKVTVQDWEKKKRAEPNKEIIQSLSQFEQHLLAVLERLEIKGKRGHIVPILLTKEHVQWVDILLANRHRFVSDENRYLFGNTRDFYFRGSDVMRKYASLCGAQRSHLLTTTRLRKSMASLAQVLGLKENEMDMVAGFMGHDLRVHREFYRMPLDVLQVARVSKLFLACDEGRISEFSGKSLSDIDMNENDIVYPETDDDQSDDGDDDVRSKRMRSDENQQRDVGGVKIVSKGRNDSVEEPSTTDITLIEKPTPKRRAKHVRVAWTQEERHLVRMHFASCIVQKVIPGKDEIQAFLDKQAWSKPWRKVKDHIRNTYMR